MKIKTLFKAIALTILSVVPYIIVIAISLFISYLISCLSITIQVIIGILVLIALAVSVVLITVCSIKDHYNKLIKDKEHDKNE